MSSPAQLESVTVQRPAPGYAGLVRRVRSLPADTVALWAFVLLAVIAVIGFFVRVTYPNYDSYYSLLWGREILHLHLPSFDAYRAPTEHPLAVAFGAVLSIFGGADEGIPPADVEAFDQACRKAGVKHEQKVYEGAPHSFFDRKYAEFAEASADAWKRVQAFVTGT